MFQTVETHEKNTKWLESYKSLAKAYEDDVNQSGTSSGSVTTTTGDEGADKSFDMTHQLLRVDLMAELNRTPEGKSEAQVFREYVQNKFLPTKKYVPCTEAEAEMLLSKLRDCVRKVDFVNSDAPVDGTNEVRQIYHESMEFSVSTKSDSVSRETLAKRQITDNGIGNLNEIWKMEANPSNQTLAQSTMSQISDLELFKGGESYQVGMKQPPYKFKPEIYKAEINPQFGVSRLSLNSFSDSKLDELERSLREQMCKTEKYVSLRFYISAC